MDERFSLAVTLVGDVSSEPGAYVKYGVFLQQLARHIPIAGVFDATLRNFARWRNAARVFHYNPTLWKARFYQNVPAFRARSKRAARWLGTLSPAPAAVMQIGVLFDTLWEQPAIPGYIYTDYTAWLSAQRNVRERSPFSSQELHEWIALERRAYQRARHVFVRSALVRESLINDYAIAPEKITVVGGGVNFEHLPEIRRVPRPPRNLFFIGKDFYRKGGDVLLLAFARLREQIPDVRLKLMTNFPKSASALPLEGVEVIAPTWNRSVIQGLYSQADVFVLPSRLETWGDVLLEAMAYGLPCVGVEGDAASEIILPGKSGFVVPQQRPGALAAALLRLCSDPQLAFHMGQAGRQHVERFCTWEHVVARMLPHFEAIKASR
ncbi:MAG: glycosyltransferase [Anaerolineae bacterium]|nr:MAG: glycosyltransferase [Anaerolineae bacterium]